MPERSEVGEALLLRLPGVDRESFAALGFAIENGEG
jgi:hypothetical protein